MSDRICVNCKYFDNGWCDNLDCAVIVYMNCHRFEPKPPPTVFDRITESLEVLAEKLVYFKDLVTSNTTPFMDRERWLSAVIDDRWFETKEEAIAATIEKLKEQSK